MIPRVSYPFHRSVQGVRIPHALQVAGAYGTIGMTATTVELNPALNASLFKQ